MTVIPARRLLDLVANAFPLWVLLACGLALVEPGLFSWLRGPAIVWALAVIMLGMGLMLSVNDLTRITSRPLAVGLILVACCPGRKSTPVPDFPAERGGSTLRADVTPQGLPGFAT